MPNEMCDHLKMKCVYCGRPLVVSKDHDCPLRDADDAARRKRRHDRRIIKAYGYKKPAKVGKRV